MKPVGAGAQHELLQGVDFPPVPLLSSPEDTASQIPYRPINGAPVDAGPFGAAFGSVCSYLHLTFPSVSRRLVVHQVIHPVHVSALSGWVLPYLAGYEFPVPFGCQRSLLGPSFPTGEFCRRCRWPTGESTIAGLHWGFHVAHQRDTTGVGAAFIPRLRCPCHATASAWSWHARDGACCSMPVFAVLVNHHSGD